MGEVEITKRFGNVKVGLFGQHFLHNLHCEFASTTILRFTINMILDYFSTFYIHH
jgi:hypothetical protein